MKQLLIATRNKGKLHELSSLLSDLPVKIVSLRDVGIEDDVQEDGDTYEENAEKKALFYARKSGLPTVSDDGGLEIAALGNTPGVRSRRWLGNEASNEELFSHMSKVAQILPDDNRAARFVVVIAFALPSGKVWSARGKVCGEIIKKPYQTEIHGFPYRPFFFLPKINKYYYNEELTEEEMYVYSHRLQALNALMPHIKLHFG